MKQMHVKQQSTFSNNDSNSRISSTQMSLRGISSSETPLRRVKNSSSTLRLSSDIKTGEIQSSFQIMSSNKSIFPTYASAEVLGSSSPEKNSTSRIDRAKVGMLLEKITGNTVRSHQIIRSPQQHNPSHHNQQHQLQQQQQLRILKPNSIRAPSSKTLDLSTPIRSESIKQLNNPISNTTHAQIHSSIRIIQDCTPNKDNNVHSSLTLNHSNNNNNRRINASTFDPFQQQAVATTTITNNEPNQLQQLRDKSDSTRKNPLEMNSSTGAESPTKQKDLSGAVATWMSHRNKFTTSDSRFNLTRSLRQQNVRLNNIVSELNEEISQVDEFKVVLQAYQSNPNPEDDSNTGTGISLHHEKRIMLLKAQVTKQQRHIKNLTSLLQSSRYAFNEVLAICHALVAGANESDLQGTSKKPIKLITSQIASGTTAATGTAVTTAATTGTTGISTSAGIIGSSGNEQHDGQDHQPDYMEQQLQPQSAISQAQAALRLSSVLSGVDDRQRFVDNFNFVYQKVIDFQQKNEEYKRLFSITPIKKISKKSSTKAQQAATVKFTNPIQDLLKTHPECFPVSTSLNSMLPSIRQSNKHRILNLIGMMHHTDRAFKKLKTFQLFQNNPYFFLESNKSNTMSLPSIVLENTKEFITFLTESNTLNFISLDAEKLMKTDSTLGKLLDKLIEFISTLRKRGENTNEVGELLTQVVIGCESLISLGIVIPQSDTGDIFLANKISKIAKEELPNSTEVFLKQQQQIPSNEAPPAIESARGQSVSANPATSTPLPGQANLFDWTEYDRQLDATLEFNEKKISLNSLFFEFQEAAKSKNLVECNTISQKISSILTNTSVLFNTRENVIKLKNIQVDYYRNLAMLAHHEASLSKSYIEKIQDDIHALLRPINAKLNTVVEAFASLFDTSKPMEPAQKQSYVGVFKKNTKEILELLNRILKEECPTNMLNILQLKASFEKKLKSILDSHLHLKHFNQKSN